MKSIWILCILVFISAEALAQDDQIKKEDQEKTEIIKTGWSPVPLPTTSYDADQGFKYGALLSLANYGDGSLHPDYNYLLYIEWSRTTKKTGINQITWDTRTLIPGIRSYFEVSLLTEQALDFYGFNGYMAEYDVDVENNITGEGLSDKFFYRHSRNLWRIKADFQGNILGNTFRWLAGIGYYGNTIDVVDTSKYEKVSTNSLYTNYINWGIISPDQANGGRHTLLKGGLIYDTRDNESNPYRGIWTEMQLHYAPSILSNRDYGYGRLIFTHRQYFTIIPDWINVAGRISYQGKIFGEMPFYMLPYLFNTAPQLTNDGVGGSKTVRGIMRNRIVGEGVGYGNLEIRGKILKTNLFKQDFYIALSSFVDAGMVLQKYHLPENLLTDHPDAAPYFNMNAKEVPHVGYGAGIHFAINQNQIVTVNTAWAVKEEDGIGMNLYINLSFLY
ncbi:BamA/TamA family outer membrane protein [Bacteroidota bacterium]